MTEQKLSKAQEEHEAWWRGFYVMKELVFNTLKNYEFDFSGCTDTDQICDVVKKGIESEIECMLKGD